MSLLTSAARRVTIVGATAAGALLLSAAPALAHITVTPDSAAAGSAAVLTFHVPNEEAKASTVRVDMQIPTMHPIAQLLVRPVPGWTISVKTITLAKPVSTDDGTFSSAVSEVIWSGGQILPGQFQDFTISADPLPAGIGHLAFKTIQTYSNGDIVRWIDLTQPGQPEPEHPAAMLTLTTTRTPAGPAAAPASASSSQAADATARLLALASLLVAFLAGLLALTVTRRFRQLLGQASQAPDPAPAGAGASASAANGSSGAGAPARRDRPVASAKTTAKRPQTRRRG